MKEINIEDILEISNDINIIDIRENYLYNIENIPGSINVPYLFLIKNPENYLDKNKEYYIYCNYGVNSKKACIELTHRGYNVINLKGGFRTYKLLEHKI